MSKDELKEFLNMTLNQQINYLEDNNVTFYDLVEEKFNLYDYTKKDKLIDITLQLTNAIHNKSQGYFYTWYQMYKLILPLIKDDIESNEQIESIENFKTDLKLSRKTHLDVIDPISGEKNE
jgi:hypothetical protein